MADTVNVIKKRMKELSVTGRITTSKKFNLIPGAARNPEEETDGIADIILWTEDSVYVWEVKSKRGKGKFDGEWMSNTEMGPKQLQRYIDHLQDKLADGKDNRTVQAGFGLANSKVKSVDGRIMNSWSGKDDGELGIRYYSRGFPRRQEPQKQEQEQEAAVPETAPGCTPIVAAIACQEDMGNAFPIPGFPGLRLPSLGGIRLPIPLPI